MPSARVGFFEHPGKYVKDFFFLRHRDVYHLFYNVGEAGPVQGWDVPGNEDSFGHATSRDLNHWDILPPVLYTTPNGWDGQVISAPSILRVGDTWKMIYTGFSDREPGNQSIGWAESEDLVNWRKSPRNPVYVGPAWTDWKPEGLADCRDAHIMEVENQFLMYTAVRTRNNRGAVAIASSSDLVNWSDLGPAFTQPDLKPATGRGRIPESPVVFQRDETYYLVTTQGFCYVSRDPTANNWRRESFTWPSEGLYAALEVLREGRRHVAAAFMWKTHGNFIRFWELGWAEGLPTIQY